MTELLGRHALVCGASQGIGRATALALAARGATVTALARSQDKLDIVRLDLLKAGAPRAHVLVADLDERDAMEATVRRHMDEHGAFQILIHNAGGPPGGRILDVDDEKPFTDSFGRHVLAAHRLLRLVLPGMQEADWGRMVNIISTSVREPIPNLGVSNVVRAGMAAWAKTVSRELPPGITINSVLPGFTDTGRLEALAQARAEREGREVEAIYEAWAAAAPEGRIARAEEVAAAAAWLCSREASFVRGIVLPVDGGRLHGI